MTTERLKKQLTTLYLFYIFLFFCVFVYSCMTTILTIPFFVFFSTFAAAPRFRNSIAGPAPESCRTIKRPHSVISVSSVSSSSTSSGGSGGHSASQGHSSIEYDSPKPYRSATLNSQCSVGEL